MANRSKWRGTGVKRELRDRLRAKYPTVYSMARGWAVGEDWYAILDGLGAELSKLRPIVAEPCPMHLI